MKNRAFSRIRTRRFIGRFDEERRMQNGGKMDGAGEMTTSGSKLEGGKVRVVRPLTLPLSSPGVYKDPPFR